MANSKQKIQPSVTSGEMPKGIRSETPLNRRMAQARRGDAPGTVRRATKQKFTVKEGSINSKSNQKAKKEAEKAKKKEKLTPDVTSRSISEEEIEKREKQKKREKLTRPRSFFGTRIVLVLGAYLCIMAISVAAMYFWWLPRHSSSETQSYTYQLGSDKDYISKNTVSWKKIRSGYVYYVNMTDIASMCSMAVTGDGGTYRYIVKSSGEYVSFTEGNSIAVVNGVTVRMEGDTRMIDGNLYVPLNFVNSVINGVSATLNLTKNKLTVDADGTELSFPFTPEAFTDSIRFVDLDDSIQRDIILRDQMRAQQEPGNE